MHTQAYYPWERVCCHIMHTVQRRAYSAKFSSHNKDVSCMCDWENVSCISLPQNTNNASHTHSQVALLGLTINICNFHRNGTNLAYFSARLTFQEWWFPADSLNSPMTINHCRKTKAGLLLGKNQGLARMQINFLLITPRWAFSLFRDLIFCSRHFYFWPEEKFLLRLFSANFVFIHEIDNNSLCLGS